MCCNNNIFLAYCQPTADIPRRVKGVHEAAQTETISLEYWTVSKGSSFTTKKGESHENGSKTLSRSLAHGKDGVASQKTGGIGRRPLPRRMEERPIVP